MENNNVVRFPGAEVSQANKKLYPGDISYRRIKAIAARFGGIVEPKRFYTVERFKGYATMTSEEVVGRMNVMAKGKNNFIWRGFGSWAYNAKVSIQGEGNTVFFGPYSKARHADIRLSGDNALFFFGAFSTDQTMTIVVEGPGQVVIADEAMLSARVIMDVSDHHSIFDAAGNRINHDANIFVDRHVWLGRDVRVNKGVSIGSGCVVGQASVVSGTLQPNSLYAGVPAKRLKEDISWSRVKANTKEEAEASERYQQILEQRQTVLQRIEAAK